MQACLVETTISKGLQPTIEKVPFSDSLRKYFWTQIKNYNYIGNVLCHSSEVFPEIYLIKVGTEIAGYAILGEATGQNIINWDDSEDDDLEANLQPAETYIYMRFLDIAWNWQLKGLGKYFVNWLKETQRHSLVGQTTADSQPFWLKQEFTFVGYSDWWMWYPFKAREVLGHS